MRASSSTSRISVRSAQIHPWGATVDDIEHPDILTFDLDPGEGVEWVFLVETALELRDLVDAEEGLDSWPKLTGGKRVIFDNGTERNLLMRSLQKALQQDPPGRRIVEPSAGPLFAGRNENGDEASGIVYVLRSESDHLVAATHRNVLHKIGVTGGDIDQRPAMRNSIRPSAWSSCGYLRAFNINSTLFENPIHRIFASARLSIEIKDEFGNLVIPRGWFLVPLFVIDPAVEKISEGSITGYIYDPQTAALVRASAYEGRRHGSEHLSWRFLSDTVSVGRRVGNPLRSSVYSVVAGRRGMRAEFRI